MGERDSKQRAISVFLQQKVNVHTVKHTLKQILFYTYCAYFYN